MKKTNILCAVAMATAMSTTAHADTIYGLYLDANYWQTSVKASVEENEVLSAITNIKAKPTLDFDGKGQIMLTAHLEHGIPFMPNARLSYTSLNTKKDAFKANLSTVDAVAYYELLDNIISVDAGLGVKRLSNSDDNNGSWLKQLENIPNKIKNSNDDSNTLGIVYASVAGALPFTGFSAKAETTYGLGKDISTVDALAEIQYKILDNLAFDVSTKTGYRVLTIKNKDFVNLKIDEKQSFSGPYVGAVLHF